MKKKTQTQLNNAALCWGTLFINGFFFQKQLVAQTATSLVFQNKRHIGIICYFTCSKILNKAHTSFLPIFRHPSWVWGVQCKPKKKIDFFTCYILNTPIPLSSPSQLCPRRLPCNDRYDMASPKPSVSRVSMGKIIPSSHSRAVA